MILVVDVVDDNVESFECSPPHEIQNNFSGLEEEAEYELRLRAMNRWASWYSQEKNFWRNNFSQKKRWVTSKAQEEYFKWKKPFFSIFFAFVFIFVWISVHCHFQTRLERALGTIPLQDCRSRWSKFWCFEVNCEPRKKDWIVGLADSKTINTMLIF